MIAKLPKLLEAQLSSDLTDPGDTLYVTAKWQCQEETGLTREVKIAVDVLDSREQRHLENKVEGFRFTFSPYPAVRDWKPLEIWSVAGAWQVPKVWGGTFIVLIGLVSEDGEALPFIGEGGRTVFRQQIAEIEIGWGWGRRMLEVQRKPCFITFNSALEREKAAGKGEETGEVKSLGDFRFHDRLPAFVGYKGERWAAREPLFTIRDLIQNKQADCFEPECRPSFRWLKEENGRVCCRAEGFFGSCRIVFDHDGDLRLRVDEVEEKEGFELLSVTFPEIVSLNGQEARLVNFFCGGREVAIEKTLPLHSTFYYDVCNAMAVENKAGAVLVVALDPEAVLYQSVTETENGKRGVLGARLRLRIPSQKKGLPSIPVRGEGILLASREKEAWKSLARLIRGRLAVKDNSLYDHMLFYKIGIDAHFQYNPGNPATFGSRETLELNGKVKQIIENVYHLSHGMKQVVYLTGWQRNGHDTEYPNPHKFGLNPRAGTLAEWRECQEFAKSRNTILSFHDNFDDAYEGEGGLSSHIAVDSRGELFKGWIWAGGLSRIVSPKAYVESGEAKERVNATLSLFGIEKSYHLDVLTSEVRRYDFNPAGQAGAQENMEHKKAIVSCFNQAGVDVTSETLIEAFTGVIGYALHTRYKFTEELFPGERVIPLTTMAFHGITPYNMDSMSDGDLMKALAYGAQGGFCDMARFGETAHLRSLYLHTRPMGYLKNLMVEDCLEEDNRMTVRYGGKSFVRVDFSAREYEIVYDGITLSKNWETLVPATGEEEKPREAVEAYLAYSATGGSLSLPLPESWLRAEVIPLTTDGPGEGQSVEIAEGILQKPLKADTPYLLKKGAVPVKR